MFTTSDLKQIKERGSDLQVVQLQIENFKTGTLEKYGLGYKDLKKDFTDEIYT